VAVNLESAGDIRTDRQAEEAGTLAAESFGLIREGVAVIVRKNGGADVGSRPRLNLIEGANIVLTVADDAIQSEIDITIALSANPDVTGEYRVSGNAVVKARGAAVADVASPDATDLATAITLVNEIKAQLNTAFARLRSTTGHGLWT
jgi:hypothetical protein